MDSCLLDNQENIKPKRCLNPPRPVRIVGNIRGFAEDGHSSQDFKPSIRVLKPEDGHSSQRVSISFREQSAGRKDSYELDYCYERNEDNSLIYSREIEPLISDVLDGRNLTVIAYGARRSGKTHTIQGTEKSPGLALLTMDGILSKAGEFGFSVCISLFEVFHERVVDLLDIQRPEIQVLEDAQGKVNLKGLSKIFVNSIQEFCSIFSCFQKAGQSTPLEARKRSHKGLIVYISSSDGNKNLKLVSRINFVDLAGYEDSRRNGGEAAEITKINKSLYALLNVIHALNVNGNRVPYRESKLTRMLKESLLGKGHTLMVTCLNPSSCQDTIHTVSLASRSCQRNTQVQVDSKKGSKSASKLHDLSSARKGRTAPPFLSAKKQAASHLQCSLKKANSISRRREVCDAEKPIISEQPKFPLVDASACERKHMTSMNLAMLPLQEEALEDKVSSSSAHMISESSVPLVSEEDELGVCRYPTQSASAEKEAKDIFLYNKLPEIIPSDVNNVEDVTLQPDVSNIEKENISLPTVGNGSPPLSQKIRKISENLKALCASTPLSLKFTEETDFSGVQVNCEDSVEPKTPVIEHNDKVHNRFEIAKYNSPWESFHQRSSGMKQSLVQDCLQFLNSASKEELKRLKGIGEKRSTYILELREESPEPFKSLDDLENIGLSAKQVKGMMRNMAGALFNEL